LSWKNLGQNLDPNPDPYWPKILVPDTDPYWDQYGTDLHGILLIIPVGGKSLTWLQEFFASKASLYTHRKSHSEERMFICPECGQSFKSKRNLQVSLSDLYWFQYGSGSSILGLYGCGFWIWVLDPDSGPRSSVPKWNVKLLCTFQNFFSSQIAMKTLSKDSQARVNNIRLSIKSPCSFQLEISYFSPPFWTPFWVSWIRIRIPITDPDPREPSQYGST